MSSSDLEFAIPNFVLTIKLERGGTVTPHNLDIVEAYDTYLRLLEHAPANDEGDKFLRDIVPQFKHFLMQEKKFPEPSYTETATIIEAVKQGYLAYKKKSADVLKLPNSSELGTILSASDSEE